MVTLGTDTAAHNIKVQFSTSQCEKISMDMGLFTFIDVRLRKRDRFSVYNIHRHTQIHTLPPPSPWLLKSYVGFFQVKNRLTI